MNKIEEDVGDYIVNVSQLLGKGAFGKIFKCHKKGNPQEEYCAKYIDKMDGGYNQDRKKIIEGEKKAFEALSQIKNENLVQLYRLVESPKHLIIIMELCDYDLEREFENVKKSKGWFSQNEQINIIKQILNGAKALFENQIIHRDIKPQNILVKNVKVGQIYKKIYKISDFGFCRRLEYVYQLANLTRVGTITHVAPEIVNNTIFNAKCDIYSYGILFYQIVCEGQLPYSSFQSDVHNFFRSINKNPFKFSIPIQGKYGQILMQLIEQMIVFRIDKRISYEELFVSEIYTELFQIIEESLFMLKDEQPTNRTNQSNESMINQQNVQKKLNRVLRIYDIQEIFLRKYLLCQHVEEYLKQNMILKDLKIMALLQLIAQIGLQQIKFAFAACTYQWCDIHDVLKNQNNNDIVKLLKIFSDYCEKSKSDEKFKIQQEKIKFAYYRQFNFCQKQYDQFLEQVQTDQAAQFFSNTIFKKIMACQVKVDDLCEELQKRKNELFQEGWLQKLPNCEKEYIQKICEIEKNQFHILNYQWIELDEIIKI